MPGTREIEPGFQNFPYPNDMEFVEDIDEDIDEEGAQVRKRKPKPATFIEGDELAQLLSEIAGELYDRGDVDLATEIAKMVGE